MSHDVSSADLGRAAARLRQAAAHAPPGPYAPEATGRLAALWTPDLARAIADWIGSWQWQTPGEDAPEDYQHAARIARLVLGEEP